jgi:NAD(P)-dependent dehydrogenase (short-subunit alcohol dehydrogenase family)
MTDTKVALVTGASSGFGKLIATLIAQEGYRVFGTSRKKDAVAMEGVEMLALDVQSDQSVQACMQEIATRTNRIDLLVNNAGQAHASFVEETGIEQAKNILETNFWGVVRVTNAVLPFMRKQGGGQIINVGSLAGLIGVPGQGFYSASKFALEGYSEALRFEVAPFNIKVSLIEPGFFRTNLHHALSHVDQMIPDYNQLRETIEKSIESAITRGGDPVQVARLVVQVARSKHPKLHYRVGKDAVRLPRLKALLPESWFEHGMRKNFNLP